MSQESSSCLIKEEYTAEFEKKVSEKLNDGWIIPIQPYINSSPYGDKYTLLIIKPQNAKNKKLITSSKNEKLTKSQENKQVFHSGVLDVLSLEGLKELSIRVFAMYYYGINYDDIQTIKDYIVNACETMSDKYLNSYLADYNLRFDVIKKDIIYKNTDELVNYIHRIYSPISKVPSIKETGIFLFDQSRNCVKNLK